MVMASLAENVAVYSNVQRVTTDEGAHRSVDNTLSQEDCGFDCLVLHVSTKVLEIDTERKIFGMGMSKAAKGPTTKRKVPRMLFVMDMVGNAGTVALHEVGVMHGISSTCREALHPGAGNLSF